MFQRRRSVVTLLRRIPPAAGPDGLAAVVRHPGWTAVGSLPRRRVPRSVAMHIFNFRRYLCALFIVFLSAVYGLLSCYFAARGFQLDQDGTNGLATNSSCGCSDVHSIMAMKGLRHSAVLSQCARTASNELTNPPAASRSGRSGTVRRRHRPANDECRGHRLGRIERKQRQHHAHDQPS